MYLFFYIAVSLYACQSQLQMEIKDSSELSEWVKTRQFLSKTESVYPVLLYRFFFSNWEQ